MSEHDVPSPTPVPGWTRGVDGNWRPPPPPRQRPVPPEPPQYRRPRKRRVVGVFAFGVFVLAVLALVAAIIAVLVDYNDTSPITSDLSHERSHAIGETARTASFDVTVNGATDPYVEPNPMLQPPAGSHYVSVDVTIANVGDRDLVVSAIQLIELTDSAGHPQSLAPNASVSPIEGPLPAHSNRRGGAVFTVSDSATKPLTLRVKGEVTAGGVAFSLP